MRQLNSLTSGTSYREAETFSRQDTPCFENGKQAIVQIDSPFGFATTEVIPLKGVAGVTDRCFCIMF